MYEKRQDTANISKLSQEIERIEEEFTDAQNRTQEYLDSRNYQVSRQKLHKRLDKLKRK